MAILPPGVSADALDSAIRAFRATVGEAGGFVSDDDLSAYHDYYSLIPEEADQLWPAAAVAPTTVEQVQAIVRTANEYKIPLFPISTGKNFAYGGPTANLRGSVIVDLKRMNRILEVDADRNFALVEPGVSYFDLYRHIQERGLKVWIDCPDPGWGSPVGNTLDHGIGYTLGPYRDHYAAHYGMEVVLANGEVMRTGMGALPGSKTWQEYKYGYGPDPSGLFGQGNFGIVTKMGFRLMPQPEHYRTGMITVPKRADLIPLVKSVNYLTDLFLIGEPWYGSPLRPLLANSDFHAAATRRGGVNEAELDRMAAAANLHAWQVELQFYGSERITEVHWDYAKEVISKAVPGARAYDGESFKTPLTKQQIENTTSPYPTNIRRNVTQGVPQLGIWKNLGRTEATPNVWAQAHIGLFAVIPRSGDAVFEAQQLFIDTLGELGFANGTSAISTPVNWYQHSFFFSAGFSTGGGNASNTPEGKAKLLAGLKTLLERSAQKGWGDYRAPPFMQDAVVSHYSFNNHALRRFNETLKDAVDPNGILAPGRGGVWPKRFREGSKA